MAYPKDTRDKVRRAYVFNQLSLELVAAQHGVTFKTARRWKTDAKEAGDDWEAIRVAHTMASGGMEEVARSVLTGLIIQFQATIEQINTTPDLNPIAKVTALASLSDAYNKAVSASKRVLPETSQLAISLEVLQMFSGFIQEHYPQHLHAFAEVLEPFGNLIEKTYGKNV